MPKTVTVKMREDQASLLSKFLGELRVAGLPTDAGPLVHQIHHGLRAIERSHDVHTLDLTAWGVEEAHRG